jgi:hypothetical protein
MSKPFFTAEDFYNPNIPGSEPQLELIAKIANAKLEAWLKDAPTIWLCETKGIKTAHLAEPIDAVKSAKLVCIEEELKKDDSDKQYFDSVKKIGW